MNKLLEQLKNYFDSIAMTESEHSRIQDGISSYINTREEQPQKSPYLQRSFFYTSRRAFQTIAIALIFMLTLGTGIAQASAEALPGDVLYPVKITAEDITSFFKTNTEEKIEWAMERTERRMEEALKLALRKKLNNNIQEEISRKIQQHAEVIAIEIKKIEEDDTAGALSAHANLETSIEAHNEVLLQVKGTLTPNEITEKNIEKIIATASEESKKALENKEKNKEKIVAEDEGTEIENPTNIKLEKIEILKKKIKEIENQNEKENPSIEKEVVEEEPVEEEVKDTAETSNQEDGEEDNTEGKVEPLPTENTTHENIDLLPEAGIVVGVEDIGEKDTVLEKNVVNTTEEIIEEITLPEFDIELMKKEVETHIQKEEYGKAIIILEDIYQYLSKMSIVEKIKKEFIGEKNTEENNENVGESKNTSTGTETEEVTEEDLHDIIPQKLEVDENDQTEKNIDDAGKDDFQDIDSVAKNPQEIS